MDLQVILILVIVLLTVTLVAVGVYLVLVLKELRSVIARVNDMLETADGVVKSLSSPLIGLSAALGAFTQGFKVFKSIKDLASKEDEDEGK
ncbi:hypothetical protein COT69_01345 [candidate division WWE3 bacterium CG09_land_8_20_14_0_10_39_24]|uniref:DUF948 domain-containing protein n=2 Tax=Katanobacteria TaxID=422282 RepID=A0A2G9XDP8_UNCKA|nr:MAG: hypothetical protein BK003_01325 [bacterium CG09_39_24]PIP04401.1 MAG: hypothetical protein COX53_02785 [candidate division WWE3 bacterium CG23_combo_of_CG06-09_8_20_14_all_40_14]PIS12946.1 MAG: hypothetical protein COT69_01345 [candidate division WWE3 bacterium CG09_land_8_20_14_0_10_39_24]PJE51825.1 MAG: hypothetical protein COV27_01295 [candidate division WWE3 bacterium CG10_big_fil_rev_8_21_14_0_10_39_14]